MFGGLFGVYSRCDIPLPILPSRDTQVYRYTQVSVVCDDGRCDVFPPGNYHSRRVYTYGVCTGPVCVCVGEEVCYPGTRSHLSHSLPTTVTLHRVSVPVCVVECGGVSTQV